MPGGGTGEGDVAEFLNRRPTARWAFILVIVCFLLSTAISLLSLHVMSQNNLRETNKVLATQIYDYIVSELSGPIMAARTMANNSFLVDAMEQEQSLDEEAFSSTVSGYLTGIEDGLGYNSSFVVSDATKKYYTRSGVIRTIHPTRNGSDSWYLSFANSQPQYDLDVDADEHDKDSLTVYVNAKVTSGDAFLGVCGVGVRMTGLQDLFRTFEQGFNVKISLVDSAGVVQVDTDSETIENASLVDLIDGARGGEYVYTELGGDRFVVTKYVDDLDWYLVVQSDGKNEATTQTKI